MGIQYNEVSKNIINNFKISEGSNNDTGSFETFNREKKENKKLQPEDIKNFDENEKIGLVGGNEFNEEGSDTIEELKEKSFTYTDNPENIKERIASAQLKMREILENMGEEALKRYEIFRRTGLSKPVLKRWAQSFLGYQMHQNACIALVGVAKIYIGELIEEALKIKEENGNDKLMPNHIYEANIRQSEEIGNFCPITQTFNSRRWVF